MLPSFQAKDPGQTVVLTFDATAGLPNGQTMTTLASPSIYVVRGTDPTQSLVVGVPFVNTAPITIGSVTVAPGNGVQVVVSAGLDTCSYLISIQAQTTNADNVLVLKAVLPVSVLDGSC